MKENWSVLMRRLKTPPYDYIPKVQVAQNLISLSPTRSSGEIQQLVWQPLLTPPRYTPTQADVATYKAIKDQPKPEKYPNVFRWYRHMTSYAPEFPSLPGDPSKPYSAYGPEKSEMSLNPKEAPAAQEDDDDEENLFGSSDSEDEDAKKQKEANLAAYKKKKEGKVKPAAKSIVTLDVKPWGRTLRSVNQRLMG